MNTHDESGLGLRVLEEKLKNMCCFKFGLQFLWCQNCTRITETLTIPGVENVIRSCLDHVDAQISGEVARAQDSNHALTINEVFRIPSECETGQKNLRIGVLLNRGSVYKNLMHPTV